MCPFISHRTRPNFVCLMPWFHARRRFWMNGSNPKRMYVVENTRDFVRAHGLKPGSILSFYCAPDGRLVRHASIAITDHN